MISKKKVIPFLLIFILNKLINDQFSLLIEK